MTYQERLDMFAAALLSGLGTELKTKKTINIIFIIAKDMIEESNRICAEREATDYYTQHITKKHQLADEIKKLSE